VEHRPGSVEDVEMNFDLWRKKKVLVTGHTGFKGSWLSLWLQNLSAEVTGYALAPTQPSLFVLADVEKGMRSILGDIRDLEQLRHAIKEFEPEVIFHLAAQSLVRSSYADPVGTYATNVMGTAHLLEVVRETEAVRSVVIVTSDKCYQDLEDGRARSESDRLGGFDPYSSSKAAAELVTAAFRDSFFRPTKQGRRIGIATARAGNVIGGGDWAADRLIPDAMRAVFAGQELLIRNPHAIRPWQHVLEPLCGYLMLAEKLHQQPDRYSESWNFGPDESEGLPVEGTLNELNRLWGGEMRWRFDGGDHPHETNCLRLDSSKARRMLGWEPKWNLHRALEATVCWYKAQQSRQNVASLTREQIQAYQMTLSQNAFSLPSVTPR
jgi:CDP-glucose 4,6-dehydratase